jgi:selenocysteine lyase/cysteine desulfurase
MTYLPDRSRRAFLSSLGIFSAATALGPSLLSARDNDGLRSEVAPRGLAPNPADFMFSPGLVYLQTGSLGPTPRPVLEYTIAKWKELELNPLYYGYGPHERAMDDVRAKAAAFIGCSTGELVLTRCTTEGMNWVAQGLGLATGDRVLITDQEHPGGRSGWEYVARKHGVVLDPVVIPAGENDAQAIVDRFAKGITPRTRAFVFSHLLTSTGLRMPVAELSALARSRNCVAIVDGAQAVGGVAVNVKALGCHVYVTSGHKWLMAPKGTGLLYLSEELGPTVDPVALQAGRAAYSDSSGVCNIPGVLGLGAAIDYSSTIGIAKTEAHNLALRDRLFEALRSLTKLRVVSAPPGPLASPLLTFVLPPGLDSTAMYETLMQKYKVVVKVVPRNWLNGNRISTHLFNTDADVDALVGALKREVG